jgi:pyrroline-5-carboxylate reductase
MAIPMKKNFTNKFSATTSTNLHDAVVGIVGFGHLGGSLAESMLRNGFSAERLLVSHRGRESTRTRIIELGLSGCLTDNHDLVQRADIVVLGIRPQDILSLAAQTFGNGVLAVSCMAGLPVDLLRNVLGTDVCRIMCSGPDTIMDGMGTATMYPVCDEVRSLLGLMGLDIMDVSSEEELDSFTIGICIPALILNSRTPKEDALSAMERMEKIYPVYGALRRWVESVTPESTANDGERYLENVCTRGGVTEAMMTLLRGGASFEEALHGGISRGREITDDVRRKIDIDRRENQPVFGAGQRHAFTFE